MAFCLLKQMSILIKYFLLLLRKMRWLQIFLIWKKCFCDFLLLVAEWEPKLDLNKIFRHYLRPTIPWSCMNKWHCIFAHRTTINKSTGQQYMQLSHIQCCFHFHFSVKNASKSTTTTKKVTLSFLIRKSYSIECCCYMLKKLPFFKVLHLNFILDFFIFL